MADSIKISLLKKLVLFGFLALGLAFVYILFAGLNVEETGDTTEQFKGMGLGQTKAFKINGQRFWVTQLNQHQRELLNAKHPCRQFTFCAIAIKHSETDSELVYQLQSPRQLDHKQPWHGGFVNPKTAVVYDVGGQAYSQLADIKYKDLKATGH